MEFMGGTGNPPLTMPKGSPNSQEIRIIDSKGPYIYIYIVFLIILIFLIFQNARARVTRARAFFKKTDFPVTILYIFVFACAQ